MTVTVLKAVLIVAMRQHSAVKTSEVIAVGFTSLGEKLEVLLKQ